MDLSELLSRDNGDNCLAMLPDLKGPQSSLCQWKARCSRFDTMQMNRSLSFRFFFLLSCHLRIGIASCSLPFRVSVFIIFGIVSKPCKYIYHITDLNRGAIKLSFSSGRLKRIVKGGGCCELHRFLPRYLSER